MIVMTDKLDWCNAAGWFTSLSRKGNDADAWYYIYSHLLHIRLDQQGKSMQRNPITSIQVALIYLCWDMYIKMWNVTLSYVERPTYIQ